MLGFGAAVIPIACQVSMQFVAWLSPKAFPDADKNLFDVDFWAIQLMLLSVAVAGGTIVNFGKTMIDHTLKKANVVVQFFILLFFFLLISLAFSVTLLDSDMGLTFIAVILILSAGGLFLAYRVEMDIALCRAGLFDST